MYFTPSQCKSDDEVSGVGDAGPGTGCPGLGMRIRGPEPPRGSVQKAPDQDSGDVTYIQTM